MSHAATAIRKGPTPRPLADRFEQSVERNGPLPEHLPDLGPCWVWTGSAYRNGYGRLSIGHSGPDVLAHRLAWELATGEPPPAGMLVCHRCDRPSCVRIDHLFLGTPRDNMRDKVSKGRANTPDRRGVRNSAARLTPSLVALIRQRYQAGGTSWARLAREFGVSKRTIGRVVRGEGWTHV